MADSTIDTRETTEMERLILRAIADPGSVLNRADDYSEPVPRWSMRALFATLNGAGLVIAAESEVTTTTEITEEQYNAAIEKLEAAYWQEDADLAGLVELIVMVREDETGHGVRMVGESRECAKDCLGCLTERIADAVTKAVNDHA